MSALGYFLVAAGCFAFAIVGVVILACVSPSPTVRPPATPLDDLMDQDGCPTCDHDEQVGDDTLALFGNDTPDMDVEAGIVYGPREMYGALDDLVTKVRAELRDMVVGHVAREETEHLDVEWFDLSHDARTGGA